MNRLLKLQKPYLRGDDVVKVQQILENGGFDIGKTGVDGVYGAKTAKAVTAYQKTYGLKVDGIVGAETWGHMTREQNTDIDVLKAQKLLNFLGYNAGAEDAIFGKKNQSGGYKVSETNGNHR